MTGSALELRGVVGFLEGASGLRRILDGADLTVRRGRPFALLGESGSGKTFLVQSVLGLHAGLPGLVEGNASVMGVDLLAGLRDLVQFEDGPSPKIRKDLARWAKVLRRRLVGVVGRRVTLVPQDPLTTLPPFHTVGRLLERAVRVGRPVVSRAEARSEATEWLHRVHMYDVEAVSRRYPHELSGGMAQRVALALALAPGPGLLVADEPTTGLDATLRVRVLALLAEAAGRYGATLLLITHDTEAARLLARDVAVLCGGRVVEEGPAEVVLDADARPKHPYTRYLLESERMLVGGLTLERPAGSVASAARGCAYRGCCPQTDDECRERRPSLERAGPDHRVACWKEAP